MILPLIGFLKRAMRQPTSLARVLPLLVALVAYGTTGLLFFEVEGRPELGWIDAIWWTIVTLTTVGYGDVFPMTTAGRFVVGVPVMVLGIGLLGYVLSVAATALIEARTKEARGMAQLKLRGHVLLINYPGTGKVARVVQELQSSMVLDKDTDIVVVDEDLEQLPGDLAKFDGVHFVRGNPTRDETLSRACLDGAARALVLSKRPGDAHSDDLTLAIVLAIEARAPHVHTVAECVDVAAEELLRKARCNSVVCAARFDAHFLGAELAMPGAQDVVDQLLSTRRGPQLLFVASGAHRRFDEASRALRDQGRLAIGVRRDGQVRLAPSDEEPLVEGDDLVVMCVAANS